MKPKDLLDIWPTQAEIARVLGLRSPSIAEWFTDGVIPEARQYQIEIASGGALRADKPANRKTNPTADPQPFPPIIDPNPSGLPASA